ncbi:MAG: hypothetical protein E3J78_08740 [Candidatus Cloacimonadota bacterium]|jgi:hypothetical protein|nr:MAG: hypothetical protein E3J78_08740 [Candidatus Cloacimonadota bacterium]
MAETIETTKNIMCPEYDEPATLRLLYEQIEGGGYKLIKMSCRLEMDMSFRGTECNHTCEKRFKDGV